MGENMLPLEKLLLFVPAMAFFVILPGPDFVLVSRMALLGGIGPGKAVALGITLHMACAMAGISAFTPPRPRFSNFSNMRARPIFSDSGARYYAKTAGQIRRKNLR